MKAQKPNLSKAIAFMSLFIFLSGCAKSTINIYDDDEGGGIPGHSRKGHTLVTFNASVENRSLTRAMTSMKSDKIYAYLPVTSASSQEILMYLES